MTTFYSAFTHNSTLAKHEPGWGSVDKTALPHIAFARKGDADKKSTWGFPHHWVEGGSKKDDQGIWANGTLYLHHGGLVAAWSAAHGGRSGQKAESAVIAHLRAHFSALGIKVAELQALAPDIDVAAVDRALVEQGLLTAAELTQKDLAARVSYLVQCGAVCTCHRSI